MINVSYHVSLSWPSNLESGKSVKLELVLELIFFICFLQTEPVFELVLK